MAAVGRPAVAAALAGAPDWEGAEGDLEDPREPAEASLAAGAWRVVRGAEGGPASADAEMRVAAGARAWGASAVRAREASEAGETQRARAVEGTAGAAEMPGARAAGTGEPAVGVVVGSPVEEVRGGVARAAAVVPGLPGLAAWAQGAAARVVARRARAHPLLLS